MGKFERAVALIVIAALTAFPIAWATADNPVDAGVLRLQGGGASGTGVAILSNTIITAAHVASRVSKLEKPDMAVSALTVERRTARVLWSNAKMDLALLYTDKALPATRTLSCRAPVLGESITIVGYPAIAGYRALGPIVTKGVISSLIQPEGKIGGLGDFYITDALVQPGNSGGPVFDSKGRVIGIAVAMFGERIKAHPADKDDAPEKEVFVGAGYTIVIPATTLCKFLGMS